MRPLGKLREDFVSAVQNQRGTLLEEVGWDSEYTKECPNCGLPADFTDLGTKVPWSYRQEEPEHFDRVLSQRNHNPTIFLCNKCGEKMYLAGWAAEGVPIYYWPSVDESAKLRKSLKEGEWTDEEEQSYRYKAQSAESGVVEWVTGWGFPAELGKAIAYEFDAGYLPVSDVYALCMDIQDMMSSEGFDTYGDAARELLRRIGGSENIKGYIASMKSNYPNVPNLESRKSKRKLKESKSRKPKRKLREGAIKVTKTDGPEWEYQLEYDGEVVDVHVSQSGRIGWADNWIQISAWGRAGLLPSEFGGPGTYGHVDYYLPESKRHKASSLKESRRSR